MLGLPPDAWGPGLIVVLVAGILSFTGLALVWMGNMRIKHRLQREENERPHYNEFLLGRYVRRHGADDTVVTYLSGWACLVGGLVVLAKAEPITEFVSRFLES